MQPFKCVGYNNLFFFYLFCFSSSGARAPDSCCTPYSSIWSGQMRIVETASGRWFVAPTPGKLCQRGWEGFLWLRGVLFLLTVLLSVKHQTRCDMLSRRWLGSFYEAQWSSSHYKCPFRCAAGRTTNEFIVIAAWWNQQLPKLWCVKVIRRWFIKGKTQIFCVLMLWDNHGCKVSARQTLRDKAQPCVIVARTLRAGECLTSDGCVNSWSTSRFPRIASAAREHVASLFVWNSLLQNTTAVRAVGEKRWSELEKRKSVGG